MKKILDLYADEVFFQKEHLFFWQTKFLFFCKKVFL